jgi:hypothetical protein
MEPETRRARPDSRQVARGNLKQNDSPYATTTVALILRQTSPGLLDHCYDRHI